MIWLHFIGQTKYAYQVYVTFNGKYGWRIVDANKNKILRVKFKNRKISCKI